MIGDAKPSFVSHPMHGLQEFAVAFSDIFRAFRRGIAAARLYEHLNNRSDADLARMDMKRENIPQAVQSFLNDPAG